MKHRFMISIASLLFTCLIIIPLAAQNPKADLFKAALTAKAEAMQNQAEIYSPTHFEKAEGHLAKADEYFQKGKTREDTQKELRMAESYFLKAVESTKLAHSQLQDCIKARTDALAVESPLYRPKEWTKSEATFKEAVCKVEEGDLASAKNKARKAEQEFRNVELESIKANYLDETHARIKEGEKSDVKKSAPKTLAKSKGLAENAEQLLIENRYDTDQVRLLAKEAKYEINHAFYLTEKIQSIENSKQTLEDVLLESESYLQAVADKLDLKVGFEQGFQKPADDIVQSIRDLQNEIADRKQDLEDKEGQINALSEQLSQLQEQLGILKSKEESLSQLMEQQKMQREKYRKVEQLFTPTEAQISRLGDQVIIRLYGLSFPSGKSTIESQYFSLLAKVIDAFKEYPDCKVTVEGHTDSYGTDKANQKLSTDRANAVREYLLATANMDPLRLEAVGYGESKPVASNETNDGRRKNRRIDVVIHP